MDGTVVEVATALTRKTADGTGAVREWWQASAKKMVVVGRTYYFGRIFWTDTAGRSLLTAAIHDVAVSGDVGVITAHINYANIGDVLTLSADKKARAVALTIKDDAGNILLSRDTKDAKMDDAGGIFAVRA